MPHSQIKLIEVAAGNEFPAALNKAVLLSISQLGWCGIKVESHNLAPMQMPEHYVEGHRLMVAVGFFDQAHFTNAFKRVVGATPKAFLRHTA